MALKKTLGIIFALLFSVNIWADSLKINPNHPDQYTVIKGDTLWDISGKFLQNPWQWPQLWDNNPQVKNPHLIYPGDTLYFSVVNGKPQLRLANNIALKPHIRTSSNDQAIRIIPTDAIAQFLTSPRVVGKNELTQSPYIIKIAGEHIVAGAGDKVYVRSILTPKSLSYTIYRAGTAYKSPDSDEILGYEATYIADASIESAGDPATLSIIRSDREVLRGDRLIVNSENKIALNYFPHPPKIQISGNIISVLDGVSQLGQHNIVVIDKGLKDGIDTGHTLDIYHRGEMVSDPYHDQKNTLVKLPDEKAGVLIIFRPFERVSYGLILKANQAIHLLDKVHTP